MLTIFIFLTLTLCVFGDDLPLVEIPDGKILGEFAKSVEGKTYMQFVGIPYAQKPIGDLRFEEPQPVKPWDDIWVANMSVNLFCIQIQHWPEPEGGRLAGSEDCLYVQVFVPGNKINKDANLDVFVHFHSGGFMFGGGQAYSGPKYLMDKNVILVSLNYRLGVMGFLSTEDENLPGNLGMKDQVMALKWINKNIKYFGGNPNSVTTTGLSAGGASTHYHYFSPLSKGLFTRGISISGCALNMWTYQEAPLKSTYKVANKIGCHMKDTKELVKCMKQRPAEQLVEATRVLRKWLFNPFSPLAPVVDKWSKNPFLPEHPYKLLTEGKIVDAPWIVSVTTSEGLYPAADYAVKDHYLPDLGKNWNEYLPAILHYENTIPKEKHDEVSQLIKKKYIGDKVVNKDTYKEVIQLVGDRAFVADIELAARLQAKAVKSPIRFYRYNYTADNVGTYSEQFTNSPIKYGVAHGDDAMLIFNEPNKIELPNMSDRDKKMSQFLLNFWASYAKTGDPNVPNWKEVCKNPDEPLNHMFINTPDEIEMRTAEELGHRKFWEEIPFLENKRLISSH